jgi:hypothetical protein
MEEIKEYLKELTDEGIIHPDVRDDIIFLIKTHISKGKVIKIEKVYVLQHRTPGEPDSGEIEGIYATKK